MGLGFSSLSTVCCYHPFPLCTAINNRANIMESISAFIQISDNMPCIDPIVLLKHSFSFILILGTRSLYLVNIPTVVKSSHRLAVTVCATCWIVNFEHF